MNKEKLKIKYKSLFELKICHFYSTFIPLNLGQINTIVLIITRVFLEKEEKNGKRSREGKKRDKRKNEGKKEQDGKKCPKSTLTENIFSNFFEEKIWMSLNSIEKTTVV